MFETKQEQGVPPTSYNWSYSPYPWPYTWVTRVITLLMGVITPLTTGSGAHLEGGTSAPSDGLDDLRAVQDLGERCSHGP